MQRGPSAGTVYAPRTARHTPSPHSALRRESALVGCHSSVEPKGPRGLSLLDEFQCEVALSRKVQRLGHA